MASNMNGNAESKCVILDPIDYQNGDHDPELDESEQKEKVNILDGLTEHRSDRAQILLKNLKNEDLVHIDSDKIPAFLRIDKDIKAKMAALAENHQNYM